MVKKLNVGMIGFNEGNGHPFSFSAIINGYDKAAMKASGWDVIYNYLECCDQTEFCNFPAKVTHVWGQDKEMCQKLSEACFIDNICENYTDMLGCVDAVIIARDDYESHFELAIPFLEQSIPVFVDKPLSLDKDELVAFRPYLEKGLLMSCSGFRYARELDAVRRDISQCQEIKHASTSVILSWEKYGIHMLEALFSITPFTVKSVLCLPSPKSEIYILKNSDGSQFVINVLGCAAKTFNLNIWTEEKRYSVEIADNFSAFRRTLAHYFQMIETSASQIASQTTLNIMKVIMAGVKSRNNQEEVYIDEFML